MLKKYLSDLILLIKLEDSKSEIKRLIKNNGIKINNSKIIEDLQFEKIKLSNQNYFKLSIGKKHLRFKLIRFFYFF